MVTQALDNYLLRGFKVPNYSMQNPPPQPSSQQQGQPQQQQPQSQALQPSHQFAHGQVTPQNQHHHAMYESDHQPQQVMYETGQQLPGSNYNEYPHSGMDMDMTNPSYLNPVQTNTMGYVDETLADDFINFGDEAGNASHQQHHF
jgi:hypothetical protein